MFPRNDEAFNRLLSEFQQTNDGSFAWESAISAAMYLPALRGLWPMSSWGTSLVYDLSGNVLSLTNSGAQADASNGNIPCANFASAGSDRLYRSDEAALDILGTEAYVTSAYRGLTMGTWLRATTSPADMMIMGKWAYSGNERSYNLRFNASSQPAAYISVDGTASTIEAHSTAVVHSEWHFVCMRFDPSANLAIWLDDNKEENTTSIPASINNSTADFEIASFNNGESYFDGRISLAFLCAAALSDAAVRRLYYRTRPAFQNRSQW